MLQEGGGALLKIGNYLATVKILGRSTP